MKITMNKVSHFEIPYDDQGRAQKFYQDVFGWQINKFADMDYYIATTCKSDPKTMMPTTLHCSLSSQELDMLFRSLQ